MTGMVTFRSERILFEGTAHWIEKANQSLCLTEDSGLWSGGAQFYCAAVLAHISSLFACGE